MRRCPVFCLGVWAWVIDYICSHLTWLCHLANMTNSILIPSSVLGCWFPWRSASLPLQSYCITFVQPVVPPKPARLCLEPFSPGETRGSGSWQLLSQPLCSLEKPCSSQCLHSVLKMRDSFYKPYRYHYNCCFFQLDTNWNLPVIASQVLWIWYHGATSNLWQSLDTNAGPLRPGDTAIIEQCLLYFLFSTVMLSWENIHWNPFCLFWNTSFSWNNSLGSYRKRISVWTTYFLKRGRETYMLNFYCLVSRSNRIHIS